MEKITAKDLGLEVNPDAPIFLESRVLEKSAELWDEFMRMEHIEPGHPSDKNEVMAAIHVIQNIIGFRIAKKFCPNLDVR